jgi:hypothetical protein
MADVPVDTTFDIEAAAAEAETLTVKLAGATVRVVANPPVGALMVFTRRLKSKDVQDQLGSILELCDKWVHEDDLTDLYDAVGSLHAGKEIESFMEVDLAELVQQVAARPTLAQSS